MKKFLVPLLFFAFTLTISAQNEENEPLDSNELKINMTNLIGFKFLDLGYERILNEEASFGANILFNIDKNSESTGLDEYRTFSLTSYYRRYFSNKYARGFFVEGFAMLHTADEERYYSNFGPYDSYTEESHTNFAVGVSAGTKYVSKRGFVAEIYLGIGRNLNENSYIEVVGRGGIAFGFRF